MRTTSKMMYRGITYSVLVALAVTSNILLGVIALLLFSLMEDVFEALTTLVRARRYQHMMPAHTRVTATFFSPFISR